MKVIIEEIVSNNNVNVEDNSIIHIVHIEEFESVSNHSQLNFDDGTNPHGTTKQDVGLGDVPNLNTTDAVNKAHEHTNFSVLNGTEESFTTALKNAYNIAVSWITTNGTNLINHLTNYSNPHSVTKSQVGLGSVDNTSDADKPISNATQGALNNKADLVAGKVPASQLPSYVDDVLEFANLAAFPATGETGKIYLALDTNKTYRWSGSVYVQLSGGIDFPSDGKTYGVKDGLAVDLGVNIDMDYPNFVIIQAVGNGFNYLGTYAHSITGTQSDFNSADSYQYRRILSANRAGSLAIMNDAGLYRVGPTKGFYYRAKIKQEDSTNIPTARFSYGFSGTASVGNINPSNYVQVLLSFAADASDTNCQIMYKNSSGTATKINLGSTMPKSSSDDYIIEFLRVKGTTIVFYKITNTTNAAVVSGSFSYSFTALALGNYKNNETVASSCGFGVRRVELYITD